MGLVTGPLKKGNEVMRHAAAGARMWTLFMICLGRERGEIGERKGWWWPVAAMQMV